MRKAPSRTGKEIDYTPNPGAIWIEEHRSELPNNMWVASKGESSLAAEPTLDELMEKLNEKSLHINDVAIAYITIDPH